MSRDTSSIEAIAAAMWLPSELLTLCHSITDPASLSPTINTHRTDHQHDHDTKLQPVPPPRHREHPKPRVVFPLLQLPLDILALHLPTHLSYDSLVSLRLSSRDLFTAIPTPEKKLLSDLTSCERQAILTAMEEGKEQSARKCCVLCGSWYPIALFTWVPDQRTAQGNCVQAEVAVMENRVCRWHQGRFERTISRLGSVKDQTTDHGWTLEEACMHCGGVLAWNRCDCEEPCQTCWKRDVWCHTRILDTKAAGVDP